MDSDSSDEHHRGTASTSFQNEINEVALSDETESDMFAHPISVDSLPSCGQEEEDKNNGFQCQESYSSAEGSEHLGARPRDNQRQYSLPGLSTSALLPSQQSDKLECDLKAKYSQSGTILEDDHGPEPTQMQPPLARPDLPSLLPLQDGLADNFIVTHSCNETILEDFHRGTQMQHTQGLPSPSLPQEQVIGHELSDGLEVNIPAKHSQDESILEDLYKDDDTQVQPPLAAPQPWPSQQHLNTPAISGETLNAGLCGNGNFSAQGVTALQGERDAGVVGNALNVDSTQDAAAGEQPVAKTCGHYNRDCCAWFPCCEQFWPCHRCHNSTGCCEAEASNATHLKCSKCHSVQEIENGATCQNCEKKMAAYFCRICKHLSNIDNEPYHCEKCGVCRTYRTRSFHCDMCGICMNIRSKDHHECRPSSAHDACCICLEDTFSGCHVLPCSHKMHHKCFFKMRVLSNLDTCPICRQSISRSQRE